MSRIAIIGSGISGLTAGYLLSQKHDVTLFEANDYLGGHTATVDVIVNGHHYAIDTGFIVFNDRTYPNFLKLMDRIKLPAKPTEMSFSVQHMNSGLEYNGHTLSTMFSQRRNLLSPNFYRFMLEILRFNRLAKQLLAKASIELEHSLGDFLDAYNFSLFFAEHYIMPMVAAIWSSPLQDTKDFPLAFFLRFFEHHGLLNVQDRPQWYVLEGGSRSYIPHLSAAITDIRLNSPVKTIHRNADTVQVLSDCGQETFDEVILACHSDQALALLTDAKTTEREVLGNLAYRNNEVVLHTDTQMLPKHRKSWASWNYRLDDQADANAATSVTYNMNILQCFESPETFCVTLNQTDDIDPTKILRQFNYAHPVYNHAAIAAQQRRSEICGQQQTHFCGAYWYNGFHEDGVKSALDVCARFGVGLNKEMKNEMHDAVTNEMNNALGAES